MYQYWVGFYEWVSYKLKISQATGIFIMKKKFIK